ncbi:kinase-like protein [Flagelloscypha sp. PMI_526]|nr:kinase-like protein [Flagelloscypha sp. PMI_526]
MSPSLTSKPAPKPRQVKSVSLTSKKNWWMVEIDEQEEDARRAISSTFERPPPSTTEVEMDRFSIHATSSVPNTSKSIIPSETSRTTPRPSPTVYRPPRHPSSLFSFPTPTAYSAPSNATVNLNPCAHGSASELFKCVVKKPDVVQLEINGEMQTNVADVTVQFLAELRVYTTVKAHRNICAFLGCLENIGMVLEFLDGRTLYDVISARPKLERLKKIDFHNQLLDGLSHLHSYGLSHGDLSLLNVQVTVASDTIKLLDFGRSVSAGSQLIAPDEEPEDPFAKLTRTNSSTHSSLKLPSPTIEQIHPGTRPFTAPEILRGECKDARLADAYSFGMILVCLDRCEHVDVKPWDQRKDLLPKNLFEGCEVFGERAREYLRKWNDGRRRLAKEDITLPMIY